jgi:NAD(P)-dependent dehydrogenase (short-subunit alcohol dehydrogenase family)
MVERNAGNIINIASMNSLRPLTKIPAYSAAKAAVANFTQWLAVHMAVEYSPSIRVNAIAPGFFMTSQNQYLLINEENGELTERGERILDHIPAGRFGSPRDLISTLMWLLDPSSNYVTGVLVPVDGGFSAYSGI